MGISLEEIYELGIQDLIIRAPKKSRKKYGPRREVTGEEKKLVNRERNKEHAKATRLRKKIFKKVGTL